MTVLETFLRLLEIPICISNSLGTLNFTIRKLVIIIRKMFKEIHMVYYMFWDYGFPEELRLNKGKIRKLFLLTESLFFKV